MKTNAMSPQVAEIRALNVGGINQILHTYLLAMVEPSPAISSLPSLWTEEDSCNNVANIFDSNTYERKRMAYAKWKDLVRKGAIWDFKMPIRTRLGASIMLCDIRSCSWYNYEVIANVHFGYVGMAAGFHPIELHGGAGIAQQQDNKGMTKWWWWITSLGDEPVDYSAVGLGIDLYKTAKPSSLDSQTFMRRLAAYKYGMEKGEPQTEPYDSGFELVPGLGPKYPTDYFNDGGRFQ